VKAAIRSVRADAATAVAQAALACASAAPVRELVRSRIDALMPSYLALDRDEAEDEPVEALVAAARPPAAKPGPLPAAKRAAKGAPAKGAGAKPAKGSARRAR